MTAVRQPSASPGDFPSHGTIYDQAKLPVDASGWIWSLNHAVSSVRLDFRKLGINSPGLLTAVVKYIADLIAVSSVDHVRNTFDALRFLQRSEHFRECDAGGGVLDLRLISELRLVEHFAAWRPRYLPASYPWRANG